MTTKNKKIIKRIIEESDKKNIKSYMNYFADDIRWKIVGMPVISGKKDFLETMKMIESTGCPEVVIKNIIAEGEFVVVESSGEQGSQFKPSYCDIYRIKNGKILELTTYIVDTTLNNEQWVKELLRKKNLERR